MNPEEKDFTAEGYELSKKIGEICKDKPAGIVLSALIHNIDRAVTCLDDHLKEAAVKLLRMQADKFEKLGSSAKLIA